jgi:ATP-dependent Clp protease, protease subunit
MAQQSEFEKYTTKHLGISSLTLHDYKQYQNKQAGQLGVPGISGFTPAIIEERSMNMVSMDVFSRLMMDRIIFMGLPVSDQVANIVVAQLLFLDNANPTKDIYMYINSPGGSVYAGLGMVDVMNYIRPNVATVCTGMAASMGAVLLAVGQKGKRSALPHSRVMIHQPSGGAQGQASEIAIMYKEMERVKAELYKIMADASGQTPEKIEHDSDRDYWMIAEEAKAYGLIDEVISQESKK